jgi:multiple sugar transport system ATP-binding protein
MAAIRLEGVEKVYPNGHVATRGLDLEIADGEFLVLVGPSGCGKSTALRLVAGLETPTRGRILIGEQDVTALPPQERDLAMVFQSYALYPHKTVRQNLEFGLRVRRTDPAVIARRVEEVAKVLGIEALLERRPGQLSGGQRQRVALGRAMVRQPRAFLLDEPLSNLDARLRVQTRAELARMHRQLGATMLYVTHDQEEAMTLGDRVAVLRDGLLQQAAPPMEVYRRPANVFVAGFIGSPAMNFFRCAARREDGALLLESPLFRLALDGGPQGQISEEVLLGVRPQDVRQADPAGADLTARVDVIQPLGSEAVVHLEVAEEKGSGQVVAVLPTEAPLAVGDLIGIRFPRDRLHLFDASAEGRLN